MEEFNKRLFAVCALLSLVSISSMFLFASLDKQTVPEYIAKNDIKYEQVLGESITSTTNTTFSLSVEGYSEIPTVTYNETVNFYGSKPYQDIVLLARGTSTNQVDFVVIEPLGSPVAWTHRSVALQPGMNNFRYISATKREATTNPTFTAGQILTSTQVSLYFDQTSFDYINYTIERRTQEPRADLLYSPESPVPDGYLDIVADFSESIQSIPLISINQQGTRDILDAPMTSIDTSNRKRWIFRYIVRKDNGIEFKNGTAIVSVRNAIDIYGRVYSNIGNNTFVIEASLETTSSGNTSTTPLIPPNSTTGTGTSSSTTTTTAPNYNNNTTIQTISQINNTNLSNAFTESDNRVIKETNDSDPSRVSKLISIDTKNSYYIFNKGSNIVIKVIYQKNPSSRMPKGRYLINGFKYNPNTTPLFADFSNIDKDFESKKQFISEERLIENNIYERYISYKLTGDELEITNQDIVVPIVYSDGLGIKQINDVLKVSVVDSPIEVSSLIIKQVEEGSSNIVEINPMQVEKIKVVKEDVVNNRVTINGKYNPDTTIMLHIYSEPSTVTIKTDENGDWSYTLKEDLEEGEHSIFVSLEEDNELPTQLIKIADFSVYATKAEADEEIYEDLSITEKEEIQPVQKSNTKLPIILVIGGTLLILLSGLFIFLVIRKQNKSSKTKPITDDSEQSDA